MGWVGARMCSEKKPKTLKMKNAMEYTESVEIHCVYN